jgi:hypothetical protein
VAIDRATVATGQQEYRDDWDCASEHCADVLVASAWETQQAVVGGGSQTAQGRAVDAGVLT